MLFLPRNIGRPLAAFLVAAKVDLPDFSTALPQGDATSAPNFPAKRRRAARTSSPALVSSFWRPVALPTSWQIATSVLLTTSGIVGRVTITSFHVDWTLVSLWPMN